MEKCFPLDSAGDLHSLSRVPLKELTIIKSGRQGGFIQHNTMDNEHINQCN